MEQPIAMKLKKYLKNFKNKYYKHIKRQNFYKRRKFINPKSWQEVSKNYLNEIRLNSNCLLFETFKSFRLFAGDGYDFDLPKTDEIKEEISVKDTWMKKNPTQAKFSSIMDVLNGYILDGILGNFKEDELKLMHQNLKNI